MEQEPTDAAPRSRPASTVVITAQPAPAASCEPLRQRSSPELEALLTQLLELLLRYPDRDLAISTALKAVSILQLEQVNTCESGQTGAITQSSSGDHLTAQPSAEEANSSPSPSWEAASAADDVATCRRSDGANSESRPERRELASMLEDYPACKRLIEAYRRVYHMPNKTPLSILFEYASRLNLQLSFGEGQNSQGYFTLALQLKNERDACLYRPGLGQAKSKKDAKQLAAAALLEVMLDHVPFQDLLYKSDKQQTFKDAQAHRSYPHAVLKGRERSMSQRHRRGNMAYPSRYTGGPQLHAFTGPSSTGHLFSSSQGLPNHYVGVQGTGSDMHGQGPVPQAGHFDIGYGQEQHRMLLARAGSDPTTGIGNMPQEVGPGAHGMGLSIPEHQMHQGLLCSELDLSAMGQQPGHGQIPGHGQLQYPHAGMNASLAAGMAHLGLQGSLMENLHGGTWQDSMMPGELAADGTAAPLGLPQQHHALSQGAMAPLPAGAFDLPWLPENSTQ